MVAVGGTTAYATGLIGTGQIRNSAVTSAKIKNHTITHADVTAKGVPAGPAIYHTPNGFFYLPYTTTGATRYKTVAKVALPKAYKRYLVTIVGEANAGVTCEIDTKQKSVAHDSWVDQETAVYTGSTTNTNLTYPIDTTTADPGGAQVQLYCTPMSSGTPTVDIREVIAVPIG